MPGIGQPINPAQMAQTGQAWSPQQMAQGLEMFRGQGATLGNPQEVKAAQEQNLAQLAMALRGAQQDQQTAADLSRPEYVQNSGGLGALAMIAQAYAGRKLRKEANESASDYAGRVFTEEQRMAQAQAEAAAKAEEAARTRDWAREDSRDETRAQREERLAMMRIDAADRRTAQQAEARIAAARIGASGQGGGGASVLSADEAKALGLTPGTVAQRDRNGKISILQAPRDAAPNPKEAALAMVYDSIDNLESGYTSGQYNTGPIEGRFGQATGDSNLQVLQADIASAVSGLRALQRVPGSGAESDRELDILLRQMPTELTDESAALDILKRARKKVDQYAGAMGVAPRTPAAPAGAPRAGEVVDGHRFKGGDPSNPANWEKM